MQSRSRLLKGSIRTQVQGSCQFTSILTSSQRPAARGCGMAWYSNSAIADLGIIMIVTSSATLVQQQHWSSLSSSLSKQMLTCRSLYRGLSLPLCIPRRVPALLISSPLAITILVVGPPRAQSFGPSVSILYVRLPDSSTTGVVVGGGLNAVSTTLPIHVQVIPGRCYGGTEAG